MAEYKKISYGGPYFKSNPDQRYLKDDEIIIPPQPIVKDDKKKIKEEIDKILKKYLKK
jgi:hypothetical protein